MAAPAVLALAVLVWEVKNRLQPNASLHSKPITGGFSFPGDVR